MPVRVAAFQLMAMLLLGIVAPVVWLRNTRSAVERLAETSWSNVNSRRCGALIHMNRLAVTAGRADTS